MKKILYFVKREVNILKKSIILVSCILTIFMAVLMGLISVRSGFVDGMCSVLDESHDFYYMRADNVDLTQMNRDFKNRFVIYGRQDITHSAFLYNSTGEGFRTIGFDDNGNFYNCEGAIVVLNDATRKKFETASKYLISGEWLDGENQICIEKSFAERLGVSIDDTVEIYGKAYSVKGVYTLENSDTDLLARYYFVPYDGEDGVYAIMVSFNAKTAYSEFKILNSCGYSMTVEGYDLSVYFEIVSPVEWVLNAIIILLLAVIAVILYTLMTVFFRQRKQFICQLKLLGADYFTVLGVYLLIAVIMVFFITLISSGIGVLFNVYFIKLCESIFGLVFRARFSALVPVIAFVTLSVICALIYLILAGKIKSDVVLQEIKTD